jgi:hypothetical protein
LKGESSLKRHRTIDRLCASNCTKRRGFSVLDLLFCLIILGLLIAICVPAQGFKDLQPCVDYIDTNQQSTSRSQLHLHMNL